MAIGPGIYHRDEGETLGSINPDCWHDVFAPIVAHLNAGDKEAAHAFIKDELDELNDYGFELLPDHECPWATAMWRDTFG